MDPLSTVTTVLSSLKIATEIAQFLKASEDTFAKAEYKLKLAEMMDALAEAKMAIANLKDVIILQNSKIREIENSHNEAISGLIFRDGAYYAEDGDGPFCTACFDSEQKKVRLTGMPNGFLDIAKYRCPRCKAMLR